MRSRLISPALAGFLMQFARAEPALRLSQPEWEARRWLAGRTFRTSRQMAWGHTAKTRRVRKSEFFLFSQIAFRGECLHVPRSMTLMAANRAQPMNQSRPWSRIVLLPTLAQGRLAVAATDHSAPRAEQTAASAPTPHRYGLDAARSPS